MSHKNFKIFMKTISVIVAGIFLWDQIVWAGGIDLVPADSQYTEEMPPADIADFEAANNDLVDRMNAIEDFEVNNEADNKVTEETADDGSVTYHVYEGGSVQAAVNNASFGDRVYLHAGTYHEHVDVKNGVDLIGEDRETTVIHGDYQARGHVVTARGNNRIENLTISGSGSYSGAPSSAVRVEGNNVKIRDNNITDNRDYGIYVRGGDNTLVEKNFFKNTKLGVQLPKNSTLIRYNTFISCNIAVNVLSGTTPTISNNIITGSTFQSIYEFAWGRTPTRGYATVNNNVFYSNRERGSYYGSATPPAVEAQTDGNVVTDPLFYNPANGDYTPAENSPAYGRGCILPAALNTVLNSASYKNIGNTVQPIFLEGTVIGYRVTYDDLSFEEFYNDGSFRGYYPSGRMFVDISPDGSSVQYIDEDWGGTGLGRVYKETRVDGSYSAKSSYYGETSQARYVDEYDSQDTCLERKEYNEEGFLVFREDYIGSIYYIYHVPSGELAAETLPDGTVNEYYDEELNRQKSVTRTDGTRTEYEDYYGITGQPQYVKEYSDDVIRTTTEYDPDGHKVTETDHGSGIFYVFYIPSGRLAAETLPDGVINEYSDEDWNGTGQGTLIKKTISEYQNYTYSDYFPGTDQARYVIHNDWGLSFTYEYNADGYLLSNIREDGLALYYYVPSGRLEKHVGPDNSYEDFLDEDWNNTGQGRRVKYYRGAYTYYYEEYYPNTDQYRYEEVHYAGMGLREIKEYDILGRMASLTEYSGGSISKITTYYEESGKTETETIPDGTVNEYYDEDLNRLKSVTAPDGTKAIYESYYAATQQAQYIKEYDGEVLQTTTEYDETGNKLNETDHTTGAVYTYYVLSGKIATETLPDGTVNEYYDEDLNRLKSVTASDGTKAVYESYYAATQQAQYVKEYSSARILVNIYEYGQDAALLDEWQYTYYSDTFYKVVSTDGQIDTYKLYGTGYKLNTSLKQNGDFYTYEYDINGVLTGSERVSSSGTIEIYDEEGTLIEKRIPDSGFFTGVNLPWNNYGYDLGEEPGTDYWIGYGSDETALYQKLEKLKNSHVRVFLLCDLRSGIDFDASGTPIAFTEKVFEDMRALVDAAETFNIKLLPAIFDYTIADGVEYEGLYQVGEHPDLISDSVKRQALFTLLDGFFDEFASDNNVYAWDIMNEPEYADAVTLTDMQDFISGIADIIHSKTGSAPVTVGSKDRVSMIDNWTQVGLDIYQYHYYDSFSGELSLDHPASDLGLDAPVIAGELEPSAVTDKFDVIFDNGYSGGFIWTDDDSFDVPVDVYDEVSAWFRGEIITYDYYGSGRIRIETYNDGKVREFDDTDLGSGGGGRLVKETFPTGAYKTFEYHTGGSYPDIVTYYLPDDTIFMEEDFDDGGSFISTTLYHGNGLVKKISRQDGSWEEYSYEGVLLGTGNIVDEYDVVYSTDGRIDKIIDGNYVEQRQYVTSGTDILYTLALNQGIIKAVREGLYEGADMMSRVVGAALNNAVTTSYGDDITVSYVDGNIQSLSVTGGYMNFYNGGDIFCQNSSDGDLYEFSGNFLTRVSTVEGNVYEFESITTSDGSIVVSIREAVINSEIFGFSDSKLSYFYYEGFRVDVTELRIDNGLTIGSLIINRGAGSEVIAANDPMRDYVRCMLEIVALDMPNIRFEYSSVLDIENILTSDYSVIEFFDSRIAKTVSAEGVEVVYDYIFSGTDITGLKLIEENAVRIFDSAGHLVSVQFDNNGELTTINFENGEIASVDSNGSYLDGITFDEEGGIEAAKLIKADGSEYFFAGGSLQDFIDSQNCEYQVNEEGQIISLTMLDNSEVYTALYSIDPADSVELIAFTSSVTGAQYVYKNDLLILVVDPAGTRVEYSYDVDGRTHEIEIYYGGVINYTYTYEYGASETIITDDIGNKRYFDSENVPVKIETPYGETYSYGYDVNADGESITVIDYSEKIRSDGVKVQYFRGAINRVERTDGSWLDNIEFNETSRELERFSYHAADGSHHNVILDGKFMQLEMEDSTRLIFYENTLIAFATSQGIVPLYDTEDGILTKHDLSGITQDADGLWDDLFLNGYINSSGEIQPSFRELETSVEMALSAAYEIARQDVFDLLKRVQSLNSLIYARDRENSGSGYVPGDSVDIAASSWRHQTYQDSRAIRFVERDFANDQWVVNMDLRAGDTTFSQGEMYLDLRYDIPGLEWQAPIDMNGKEISFLFKLDDTFEHDPNHSLNIQVFAKDDDWNTQYGTKIEMIDSSDWIKVSLVPTADNVNMGYSDPGFDPSSIVMMGIRIIQPEYAPAGTDYIGNVLIKHDMLPDIFANVNYEGSPLDDLYAGLGLIRDLDRLGGEPGTVTDAEAGLEAFVSAIGDGPSDLYEETLLQYVNFHPETEADHIKGITSVYRDASSGEYVMDVDLLSGSTTNGEGEIYFDIASDVPGLGWSGTVNLTSRPVKLLLEVPEELIGSTTVPNGARVFVEDVNSNMQYGTWVNLKEGEKWYQLELAPTFGDLPMGYTDPNFDPSKIKRVGVNIATQAGSATSFQGEVKLKFLQSSADGSTGEVLNTPLWMDLRNIREYIVDENDNYIRVPYVSYLGESHFDYVFNQGSGDAPTYNFDVIDAPSTNWKVQNGGITGVSWSTADSGANVLRANMDLSSNYSGELLLDLRYNCWVPGKNWQEGASVDLTTQQIVFKVRPADGFTANTSQPFSVEAFAQSGANWNIQYSSTVSVSDADGWVEIVLTPSPIDFRDAFRYTDPNFDPSNVVGIGLKFSKNSSLYSYTGPLEIMYDVRDISGGLSYITEGAQLPSGPVWVNQRDLVEYLKTNSIGLYGDFNIMDEFKGLAGDIPSYELPGDFAAMTVFDSDDTVVSITKPDGTTTYFDDQGKMDFISFNSGDIFVDYEYDGGGGLASATMVGARNSLRASIDEVVLELDNAMADTLLLLAEQKSLLIENFMEDVNAQRQVFASARSQLESQRYQRIKHNWCGVIWYETVEVPGINDAISQVNQQEAEYNRQVAEQLAVLDAEMQTTYDEVLAEKTSVLDEYSWQEKKMFLSLLRQEAIPLLHYYYRNILGRDADKMEIETVFRRIDSNNDGPGFFIEDIMDIEGLIFAFKSDESGVSDILSAELMAFIDGYVSGDTVADTHKEKLLIDLDNIIRTDDLYVRLSDHYGEAVFSGMLSSETLALISDIETELVSDGMTFEGFLQAGVSLSDDLKSMRYWLNRYIVQDLFDGIAHKPRDALLFDAEALKTELTVLSERAEREAFKLNVTAEIMASLEAVLNGTLSIETLLNDLGLSPDEIIEISPEYVSAVRSWLESQDIHFGRSAVGSLQKMLSEKGINASMEDLAEQALLIDLLIGASGPHIDKDIAISMLALSKVSALYGLDASGSNLSYEDILALNGPFITLVNKYHYVTVLSVDEYMVTFWDQNNGAAGDVTTVTRKEFEYMWQGNVITDEVVAPEKELTDAAAKNIKGAFFGLLFGALFVIFQAIATIVTTVVITIGTIIAPLLTFVSNIAAGLIGAILNVGSIFSFIGKAFMGAVGMGAVGGTTTGGVLSSLVSSATTTLVKIGVGYGVSIGLEALGVDPIISGLVSSIVTGGISGFLEGGLDLAFKTALQYGAYTGMSLLGQHLDLDPVITSILAMSVGKLFGMGLGPDATFGKVLDEVIKPMAFELAGYGIEYVGMELGLDPGISYLAGIGIRNSLHAGLGMGLGQGGGSPGDNFLGFDLNLAEQAFRDTLKSELPYLALGWISSQIGLDPSILNQLAPTMEALITPIIDARTAGEAISNTWNMVERVSAVFMNMVVSGVEGLADLLNPVNIWETLQNSTQSIMGNWDNIMQTALDFTWADDLFDWDSGVLNGGDEVLQMIWENKDGVIGVFDNYHWLEESVGIGVGEYSLDMTNNMLDFIWANQETILEELNCYVNGFRAPEVMLHPTLPYANIDLNLDYPNTLHNMGFDIVEMLIANYEGLSEEIINLFVGGTFWDVNTSLAAVDRARLFDEGEQFVYDGGVNSSGLNYEDRETFYDELRVNKKVSVGFSAGTVDVFKSWMIDSAIKPDHYVLISPQLSPYEIGQAMKQYGIPADKVTIVEIAGDFPPRWSGEFSDNTNDEGTKTWNYVKLLEGGNLTNWAFINHGAAIQGILNSVVYDDILLNGESQADKTLQEILHSLIEGGDE